jgi:hypothetical protein
MTTLEDLRQRVLSQIMGYTRDQQQVSELAVAMTPTDTTFTLDSNTAQNISRGLVEIDDELILVKSLDFSTNVATVIGLQNGRGRMGTTATSHAINSLVTMSPQVPRIRVTEAINQTILAMYPTIPIFTATEITKLAPVFEYQMPADTDDIWYIVADTVGPTQVHYPAPRWRFNPMAPTSDFPTGKSIQLLDYVTPGRAMRVVYLRAPSQLVNSTDLLTSTGFEDRMAEAVVWGACARMIPTFEAGRLQQLTVEGTERANLVPALAAAKTAAYYEQLFEQAVQRERDRILEETPNYAFWQGG